MTANRLPFISLLVLALVGCQRAAAPAAGNTVSVPPPPDVGSVSQFLNCKANPRRPLNEREKCEMSALAARCTTLDDCYVSCIASPDGIHVGGGCTHVCFGMHSEAPMPVELSNCSNLPGPSGLAPGR
jgi:hypothetical protein